MDVTGPELGQRIAALRRARRLGTRDVAAWARVSHTYLEKLEAGAIAQPRPNTLIAFERIAERFGWPSLAAMMASRELDPPPVPNGVAKPLDNAAAALSAGAPAALSSPDAGPEGGPGDVLRRASWYPGYVLWSRDDPRDPNTLATANSRGRHVMSDDDDLRAYPDIRAVRVEQVGPLALETEHGLVGANWRLFVQVTDAGAELPPGATVAAMSARGELVVGELERDGDGGWSVVVGPGEAEAVRREDVIGPIVKVHPPALWRFRVRRERRGGAG